MSTKVKDIDIKNWCYQNKIFWSKYFEEINGNKYLAVVLNNESKEKIQKNLKNCGVKSRI